MEPGPDARRLERRGGGGGFDKARNVGAFGEVDAEGVGGAGTGVVFDELVAEAAGFDANGGVGLGFVIGAAFVDGDADVVFLQAVGTTGESLLDDVAKEAGKLFGSDELGAGENFR